MARIPFLEKNGRGGNKMLFFGGFCFPSVSAEV